jgi:hypothetical protein
VVTLVFFALVMFIFWLGGLSERGKAGAHGHAPAPAIAGGSSSEGAPHGRASGATAPSETSPRIGGGGEAAARTGPVS